MRWTEDQLKVINTRGKNILVSAAAGSGKTAVLVERIMKLITDPEAPMDVDELLIVTFTRAAAGEMKERILKAITEARVKNPEDEHLARQTVLIHNAQITTIDGFCSFVIRNYGYTIGIVPGFRVAEEGEIRLLRRDVVKTVLEEAYAEADADRVGRPDFEERIAAASFYRFVETLASGKDDSALEEMILKVYETAVSSPDPSGWLLACRRMNRAQSAEEVERSEWMKEYLRGVHDSIHMLLSTAERNLEIASSADGLQAYLSNAEAELELVTKLDAAGSYSELRNIFAGAEFGRLKPVRGNSDPVQTALRAEFKTNRERIKKEITAYQTDSFSMDLEASAELLKMSGEISDVLISLTERFMAKFDEAKKKKNLMDFSDIEHTALRILRNSGEETEINPVALENGQERKTADRKRRTWAAKELAARFREVMCDEYQDSNYLQEEILTAVSRIEDGEPNYFCVGDVKQSIYSFRQARPDLFMKKFNTYDGTRGNGVRIDLHQNFRSRQEVIMGANAVFRQIMMREIGGVEYDDEAALVKGADYDDSEEGFETEIMPVLVGETDAEGEPILEDTGAEAGKEVEARAIGTRILKMVGHEKIRDDRTGLMRPVQFRDIVILQRSVRGSADAMVRVLESMRIPAYSDAKTGYFMAQEVQEVLSFLEILDNPQQDIPLVTVLRSAFAGLSAEQLALVRGESGRKSAGNDLSENGETERDSTENGRTESRQTEKDRAGAAEAEYYSLYDAARRYADCGSNPELAGRLESFFAFYEELLMDLPDMPLHELINKMISVGGFRDYCSALPGGDQRALNLRMLADQASDYEKTGYMGLFNFVRYIRNLEKEEADPGELSTISESEDVVRIYSIHKSKGLEYPVVFVAGMSRQLNLRDLNQTPLVHSSMGVAVPCADLERRIKYTTIRQEAVRARMRRDLVGEELRILYVAMTRAKQKLILSGTVKDEKSMADAALLLPAGEDALPAGFILNAKSSFDWILAAADRILRLDQKTGRRPFMKLMPVSPLDLAVSEGKTSIRREDELRMLSSLRADVIYDSAMRRQIEEKFSYRYPYTGRENIPVEISVSELKRAGYEEKEAEENAEREIVHLYAQEEEEPVVPEFIREREARAREAEKRKNAGNAEIGEDIEAGTYTDAGERPESEDRTEPAGDRSGMQNPENRGVYPAGLTRSARGTAYHLFMEHLNLAALEGLGGKDLRKAVEIQKSSLLADGRMTAEEAAAVRSRDAAAFAESEIGQRMICADKNGRLFREQQFVYAVPASEVREDWPSDEQIYVQGIADAYFIEEGKLILLDYKTDRVVDAEELVERYAVQLELYRTALERATGLKVAEKLIWSFALRETIAL